MIVTLSARSIPNARFSRLNPAQVLFISPSTNNMANTVLAQSQTRLASLPSTIADIKNLHAFGASVASFLSSRDTVKSFAKFARNLLSLSTPNQVVLTELQILFVNDLKIFL